MLQLCETFTSLQGESTFAGLPCFFIRLTGCNLRCGYCDTSYAFAQGTPVSIEEILKLTQEALCPWQGRSYGSFPLPIIELTGGEPMIHPETPELLKRLCDTQHPVLLETNGSLPLDQVDPRIHRIIDVKLPSSGVLSHNNPQILQQLRPNDQIKFVLGSYEDYNWLKNFLHLHSRLFQGTTLLLSWYSMSPEMAFSLDHHPISRAKLAELILQDALPVRLQIQLHKILWPNEDRLR